MPSPWESYSGPAGIPTDCSAYNLPAADVVECGLEYEAHEGEICDVWIVGATYNGATGLYEANSLPTNWTYRSDLDGIANVMHFEVIGDKPLGEPREVAIPKFRTLVTERTHTLTFDNIHITDNNYEAIRFLQANGLFVAFWYADYDERVYGGANGIVGWVQNAGHIHSRGEGSLLIGQGQLQWRNIFDPPTATLNSGASPFMAGMTADDRPRRAQAFNAPKAREAVKAKSTTKKKAE